MTPPGTGQLKLRLDTEAAANLQRVSRRDGLTQRACVEVAIQLATLFCGDVERRRSELPHFSPEELEALERAVAAAWPACYRLASRDAYGGIERTAVTVQVEEPRLQELKECAEARRVPVNAILATVFTPWGSGWCERGDPAYELRDKLWEWAAQPARERDADRRSRLSQDAPQPPAADVTDPEANGDDLLSGRGPPSRFSA